MTDQAAALRRAMQRETQPLYGAGSRTPAVVIGSGKGGVGKSVLAALMAHALAREGLRVLLVDGDEELANLHVLLHITPPHGMDAILSGTVSVNSGIVPIDDRLFVYPGGSGSAAMQHAGPVERGRVFNRIADCFVDFDIVVIDAGAGIEGALRLSQIAGTSLFVVATPEPASVTDAFAVTKIMRNRVPGFPIELIVNRALNAEEGLGAAGRVQVACRRFLNFECPLVSIIAENADVNAVVRSGGDLLSLDSDNAAVRAVEQIASQVMTRDGLTSTPAVAP